jgi:hypothetical protein
VPPSSLLRWRYAAGDTVTIGFTSQILQVHARVKASNYYRLSDGSLVSDGALL